MSKFLQFSIYSSPQETIIIELNDKRQNTMIRINIIIIIIIIIIKITTMGRFLFEMLINYNLVKKFPTFEETQIFFNAFTKACDLSPA